MLKMLRIAAHSCCFCTLGVDLLHYTVYADQPSLVSLCMAFRASQCRCVSRVVASMYVKPLDMLLVCAYTCVSSFECAVHVCCSLCCILPVGIMSTATSR
jgi:hypothetical protein